MIVRLVLLYWYSWLAMWKWIVCEYKKKFVEAASSTFQIIIYNYHITNELLANQIHHKWQRSECGWKCFNLRTHTYKLTSCWSVFYNWSYVDSLGLNACKWVALRTGMNLFLWCGLVLFRLDETTNIYNISIITLVIMKWFHLTCCEKSIYALKMYMHIYITKLSDWSCRWLSFILKIKPCMSKYELV